MQNQQKASIGRLFWFIGLEGLPREALWVKLAPRSIVGTAGFTRYARPSGRPLFKKRAVAQDSCAILVNLLRNKLCLLLKLRILRC